MGLRHVAPSAQVAPVVVFTVVLCSVACDAYQQYGDVLGSSGELLPEVSGGQYDPGWAAGVSGDAYAQTAQGVPSYQGYDFAALPPQQESPTQFAALLQQDTQLLQHQGGLQQQELQQPQQPMLMQQSQWAENLHQQQLQQQKQQQQMMQQQTRADALEQQQLQQQMTQRPSWVEQQQLEQQQQQQTMQSAPWEDATGAPYVVGQLSESGGPYADVAYAQYPADAAANYAANVPYYAFPPDTILPQARDAVGRESAVSADEPLATNLALGQLDSQLVVAPRHAPEAPAQVPQQQQQQPPPPQASRQQGLVQRLAAVGPQMPDAAKLAAAATAVAAPSVAHFVSEHRPQAAALALTATSTLRNASHTLRVTANTLEDAAKGFDGKYFRDYWYNNTAQQNPTTVAVSAGIWFVLVMIVGFLYYDHKAHPPLPRDQLNHAIPHGEFAFDLFDCCADRSLCIFSCLCGGIRWADTIRMSNFLGFWPALLLYQILQGLSTIMYLSVLGLLWLSLVVYYRQKIRQRFDMRAFGCGEIISDTCVYCFCTVCAIVQEARQLEEYYQMDPQLAMNAGIGHHFDNPNMV